MHFKQSRVKKLKSVLQLFSLGKFMNHFWKAKSNPVNNLSEGIHKIKCKYGHDDKKCETCGIKYKYCGCFLEYTNFKDDLVEYKCLLCNKNCHRKFHKKLKEWFFNTYTFSNDNKLREGVFPYECNMDDW